MVARADYMYNTTWVCQQTVAGWGGTFYKGNTYHIPYGQPIYSGKYIGFSATVEEFLEAAASAGSIFYTGRSYYTGTTAPYYVSDCSAFVSWCWGISRTTTYYIPGVTTQIGAVTTHNCTYNLQLGDALNHPEHVIMVSGLSYDANGAITQIEITEQTPPQLKRSYYTPSQLAAKYSAYTIYRYYGDVPAAPNATVLDGWQNVDGSWYYYINNEKQTGWLDDNGTWYYLDANGVMQTGWEKVDGKWYYMNSSGAMQTGWKKIDGTWYYLGSSGAMHTGWLLKGDKWYYLKPSNGVMQTGWILVDDCWYFMDLKSGAMITGWLLERGSWYYLNPANGMMQTGWVNINGTAYYFGTGGVMVTGTQVIDGVSYVFDDNGALIQGQIPRGQAGNGKIYADGLDISYWDGEDFDLQAVKDAGYDYVIIRAGSTNLGEDVYFQTFYDRAREVGLDIGAYFYSYATTAEDAIADANKCLSYIQGKTFEYPIYFDYEDACQKELTSAESTEICLAFMDTIEAGGYLSGVYSYASRFNNLDMATICAKHEGWVAHYSDNTHESLDALYSGSYGMLQYTSEMYVGSVGGFDANVSYKDYPTMVKQYGLNGYGLEGGSVTVAEGLPNRPGTDPDKLYFPACADSHTSLELALVSSGMRSVTDEQIDMIAQANGISDYIATTEQIDFLLDLLKDGELVLPDGITIVSKPISYLPACDAQYESLTDALNAAGITDVSAEYLMKVAQVNGFENYGYTDAENTALLDLMKAGKLISPEGYILTGWQYFYDTWYYYNEDGSVKTGWFLYEDDWYYLDASGAMQTGWTYVGGKWFYMNASGVMQYGWICDEGKWYYLRTDGSMVTGTHIINGVAYTFDNSGAWIPSEYPGGMAGDGKVYTVGIDVSYWNGTNFDFQAVKNAGYDFVIIRCGSTNVGKDENFELNYQKARAAGLDVGAYFYTYATTVDGAISDANKCLSYISGKTFEYPIYFDYEDACQLDLAQSLQTEICLAFMDTLSANGYVTGLCSYAAKISSMDMDTIGAKYECWIANYVDETHTTMDPVYSSKYGLYQYSSTLYIGSMGPIDANVSYKDYPTIMKQYGLNGYTKETADVTCYHETHDIYGNCYMCDQLVGHSYAEGICNVCGVACSHVWSNGTCGTCGLVCAHTYADGVCTVCGGKEPVSLPTVTGKSFSLSFEDEILVNFYYTISDTANVAEQGMLVFYADPGSVDISAADEVYADAVYDEAKDRYMSTTAGIAAKEMGDDRCYAAYAKLADGTYVYSNLYNYSPKKYATNMLAKSTTTEAQKALCVAMLNYGAAAQTYFGYKTDSLMNAALTEEQQALVLPYSADLLVGAVAADSSKVGSFVKTDDGFTKKTASVSFDSAFSINYYFTAAYEPAGDMTFYYWSAADYAAADVLTAANATDIVSMELADNGSYWAMVDGIAAKEIDDTVYVAGVYTANGETYCTGIVAYSLSAYCKKTAAGTSDMQPLAAAAGVYGYYAKAYFS